MYVNVHDILEASNRSESTATFKNRNCSVRGEMAEEWWAAPARRSLDNFQMLSIATAWALDGSEIVVASLASRSGTHQLDDVYESRDRRASGQEAWFLGPGARAFHNLS
jgi:hypothetical protein